MNEVSSYDCPIFFLAKSGLIQISPEAKSLTVINNVHVGYA